MTMRYKIGLWQLSGFAVSTLLGTLLHFLYDLLGGALWIAPFSGVNESTFEHMKLLFWPMLIFAMVQATFFTERGDFLWIKLSGILLGLALIPILYYTYNGVVGKSPDFVNIAIFFVAAALSYAYEAKRLISGNIIREGRLIPALILALIGICFVLFTFFPPELAIFKDPISGESGIG